MSIGFEAPTFDELLAEQAAVQAEKFQGRLLSEYNRRIFPGQNWREPQGSAVVDFVGAIVKDNERTTLEGVLEELANARPGEPVSWVDMGGGRGLAMRQLGATPHLGSRLKMTNVDLFDFGLQGLEENELRYLEDLAPTMLQPDAEPTLIIGNVETVALAEPADIITSVEVIQYLNNPLAAVANWYNQLADDGMLFIAASGEWASWIGYQPEHKNLDREATPTKHLLEELTRAGINYAVTCESDWENGTRPKVDPNYFRILAIQKKTGTLLHVTKPVINVRSNPYSFKSTYYELPTTGTSIVEVVHVDTRVALGATALGSTN